MQSIARVSSSKGNKDLTLSFLRNPFELVIVGFVLLAFICNVRLVLEGHAFVRRGAFTLVLLASRSNYLIPSSKRR